MGYGQSFLTRTNSNELGGDNTRNEGMRRGPRTYVHGYPGYILNKMEHKILAVNEFEQRHNDMTAEGEGIN